MKLKTRIRRLRKRLGRKALREPKTKSQMRDVSKKTDKIWESFLPFVSQWYWHKNWLNEWSKAFYRGPRIEWMYLMSEKVEPPKDA